MICKSELTTDQLLDDRQDNSPGVLYHDASDLSGRFAKSTSFCAVDSSADKGPTAQTARARRILFQPIEFIPSQEFADPDATAEILAPTPGLPAETIQSGDLPELSKAPAGTPPYLASLYEVPLLTKAQEQHLFRKMNFLKFRAEQTRRTLGRQCPEPDLLDRIEDDLSKALAIRNYIIRANLRLVVSIAKTVVDRSNSFEELVSDGNVPLIRAVEIFDFERGTRFSTYATWAVRNSLYRSTPRNRRHHKRYLTGSDTFFESASDHRTSVGAQESYHRRLRAVIDRMLSKLDRRDKQIVIARFGLDKAGKPRKFREIAEGLNISTERVRQLLARSLGRLQEFAEFESIELV